MYEKKKVEAEMKGMGADLECENCDRKKTFVICMDCHNIVSNMRVRRSCIKHPKAFFLMDLAKCTKCKNQNLLEYGVDDMPERYSNEIRRLLLADNPPASPPPAQPYNSARTPPPASVAPRAQSFSALSRPQQAPAYSASVPPPAQLYSVPSRQQSQSYSTPTPPPTQPLFAPSRPQEAHAYLASVPPPAQPYSFPSRQLVLNPLAPPFEQQEPTVPRSRGRGGQKRSRIDLAAISTPTGGTSPRLSASCSGMEPTPPSTPTSCNCNRKVSYIYCSNCGWVGDGIRKQIPCETHGRAVISESQDVLTCPECTGSGNLLEEY